MRTSGFLANTRMTLADVISSNTRYISRIKTLSTSNNSKSRRYIRPPLRNKSVSGSNLALFNPPSHATTVPSLLSKRRMAIFGWSKTFSSTQRKTYPDRYSMRHVNDCIYEIGKSDSSIFSTIDLTSGFWQMVLKPECREYTTFTVYGMGQYEFCTSPMGLLGCPASFQRLMEAAIKGIPGVLVYIDDILIHSKTHEQHQEYFSVLPDTI